ncbi:MAG: hypothetical protein MJE66_00480 [Proteobacteria bacterium]|nr:hypothetical protein [Pseudomonadota bacterium]
MDALERVAAAGGQLLRVERVPDAPGTGALGFVLTFDVGSVWVLTAEGGTRVGVVPLEAGEDPPERVAADEDEPWWRLLGSPLARVSVISEEPPRESVRLQFRADHQNPRRVRLAPEAETLRVRLEPYAVEAEGDRHVG